MAIDLLSKYLLKNPQERLTAKQALEHEWFHNVYYQVHNAERINKAAIINLTKFKFSTKFHKLVLKYLSYSIDSADIDSLRETFQALDINHSGVLSKKELDAGFKLIGLKINEEEINNIISKIEDSDEHSIDFSTFLLASIDLNKYVDKNKLILAFSYFDIDKSNSITIADLEESLLRLGKKVIYKNDLLQIILEANNKDSISFNEFMLLFGYEI